jgi:antitoxin CcdA
METRESMNLSIDHALLEEARSLDLDIPHAAEMGIAAAVRHRKSSQWQSENAEAIRSSNDWVNQHRLPLSDYRLF